MMELAPEDPRRHGLVQWLFLNKKLNHWKSTRATAEVIYALVHYLEKEGQLGVREAATVRVAGQTTTFNFDPDRYTGKRNQVVVPGEKIDPATASTVTVEKETPGLLFASATWHFSTEQLPKEAESDLFGVTRRYYRRVRKGDEAVLQPLDEGAAAQARRRGRGAPLDHQPRAAEYVHLRDPRAAGLEPDGARSGYTLGPGDLLVRGDPRQRRQLLLRVAAGGGVHLQATACAPTWPAPSRSGRPRCSRCTPPSSRPTRRETS